MIILRHNELTDIDIDMDRDMQRVVLLTQGGENANTYTERTECDLSS